MHAHGAIVRQHRFLSGDEWSWSIGEPVEDTANKWMNGSTKIGTKMLLHLLPIQHIHTQNTFNHTFIGYHRLRNLCANNDVWRCLEQISMPKVFHFTDLSERSMFVLCAKLKRTAKIDLSYRFQSIHMSYLPMFHNIVASSCCFCCCCWRFLYQRRFRPVICHQVLTQPL